MRRCVSLSCCDKSDRVVRIYATNYPFWCLSPTSHYARARFNTPSGARDFARNVAFTTADRRWNGRASVEWWESMSDRYGWHDDEFEVVKKGGRPSGGGPTPEVSGVNNDIEKAYHDPEPHDERDIEYREEQFRSFKQLGWTPEM